MRAIGQTSLWALATATSLAFPATADVLVSHGISPFGDLKYPADFPHLDYVNPDAPKGGEISVWTFGGFDSLNPYTTSGRAGALSSIFHESMLEGVADEYGTKYCLLCKTMEYPTDRSWVIFELRDGITFSDGSPLTTEDVVFSYETFRTKAISDFRVIFSQQVESVEALSPTRVKFTFKTGIPTRDLPETVGSLPILSKKHYLAEGLDLERSQTKPFLGSGPYVFDRIDMGRTVVVKRNPDYWGKDLPLNKGRHNFDRIRVEYYADYAAAFEGFKAGNYTFRNEASSLSWATGYDFPAVKAGHIKKVELPDGQKASGQAFIMNLRRAKFQDPRVREAVGLMFNFEWSNETLFYGIYDRIQSFWENSELEATGTPDEAELAILKPLVEEGLLEASILTDEALLQPTWGDRQKDRANLRRANQLLDEAGWPIGADKIRRNAAGEPLRIEILNDSPTFDRVLTPYVEQLRKVGIDAVMSSIDNSQMKSRENPPNFDFDMVIGGVRTSMIPGPELMQSLSSQTSQNSSYNLMGLALPVIDKLIDQVVAATTREEMTLRTRVLDRVLRAQKIWVPQWYKSVHTIAYYDQFSHPETLPPYALGELDFWWYDAEKAAALRAAGALR